MVFDNIFRINLLDMVVLSAFNKSHDFQNAANRGNANATQ